MKSRLASTAVLLLLVPSALFAVGAEAIIDVTKAQVIIGQVQQTLAKLKEAQAAASAVAGAAAAEAPPAPVAPEALTDSSGKFFLPFDAKGNLTGWANKAVSGAVGSAVGAKAGEKAGSMLAAKVPFGGLLAMGTKKKGQELGAVAAMGGADFIRKSSSYSFNSLEDLSLYLHLNCSNNADYVKGFAAAMALYPELEKTYEATVRKAYGGN
ncbi:MAG TPA: hypothetical protein VHD61_04330 [Lacunisphaera sp.]|nr:hypothetical protein [Lacunisphaera sp.]